MEVAIEFRTELGQILLLVERQPTRLRPRRRFPGFDKSNGGAGAIGNSNDWQFPADLEEDVLPVETLNECVPGFFSFNTNRGVDLGQLLDQGFVGLAVPGFVEFEGLVQLGVFVFDVRQQRHPPTQQRFLLRIADVVGQMTVGTFVVVQS